MPDARGAGSPAQRPETLYRFGRFELDPARFRLTGPEGPIAVEPRVVEVLAYLLEHRDRAVGKKELIEAVWQGRALGDAAIGRAIYQARKALGDDARTQAVVATVHGRGYRIATGLEVEALPAARAPFDGDRHSVARTDDGVAGRRRLLPWALLAGMSLAAVTTVWWWSAERDFGPPPAAGRSLRIAVVPPSAESRLAALAVCDALRLRLEQAGGTLVRDCAATARVAERVSSLTEVAAGVGADAVLSGFLREGRLSTELFVTHPDPGAKAASRRQVLEPVSLDDPLSPGGGLGEATDRLARAILDHLDGPDLPRPTSPVAPGPGVHALYLRARSTTAVSCVGGGRLDLLAETTERAPRFAPAWLELAVEHLERASFCGAHRSHYASALAALERAGEVGSTAVEIAAMTAEALLATGRVEEAYREIERAERRGSDPRLDWSAARALLYAGQPLAAAVRAARALAGDPDHDLHGWTTGLLASELPEMVRSRDDPPGLLAKGLVALRASDPSAAARAVRPAFRADPAHQYARLAEGLQALAERETGDTIRIAGELARARLAIGGGDPVVDYRIGQLLALAGDTAAAAHSLELALAGGYVWGTAFDRDPLWVASRSEALFGPLLQAAALARRLEREAAGLHRAESRP